MARTTVHTSCRICVGCGFEFQVEDGEIVSFTPDRGHPFSRGYSCPKGVAGIEFQQGSRERLTHSLAKGPDGVHAEIDARRACEEIGERLTSLVAEHGPRSVALFFGTGAFQNTLGNIFSKAWLHAVGSPNFFSTTTIDQSSHSVTAGRMGRFLSGRPAAADLDLVLISGSNPVVSHGSPLALARGASPTRNLAEFRQRGTRCIVVDPRRTETTRYADLHLQLIPGEDATLYAGLIHLLFRHDWIDSTFCERFATGVERLREAVREFTPEYVSKRAGVSPADLEEAAWLLGTARRPRASCATGTSMAPDSNLADFLLECLNVLRGAYRRAGERVENQTPLAGGAFAVEDVSPPNRSWEDGEKCRTQDAGRIFGEFPTALLPDEILQPGPDRIRALVVFGGNLAMALGDPEKTLRALGDLELLVTLDHRMTETAELSDFVLATSTQYERRDLNGFTEALPDWTYTQLFRSVVEKPESVLHDWEAFWEISHAMGLELELRYTAWSADYAALPPGLPIDMERKPTDEELLRWICEQKSISFDALEAATRGVAPDLPPFLVAPAPEDTGARLDVCPPDVQGEVARLRARPPVDGRYRLAVRRLRAVMNSHYRNSRYAKRIVPRNFAYMNPADLEAEGLEEGSPIEIGTAQGRILGTVKPDPTVRRGVISMSHCFGALDPSDDPEGALGAHTGRLIPLDPKRSEPINFMPHMTGIPVEIEPR
jgi:anaerobic selenocysteine-containing dehydrogenase